MPATCPDKSGAAQGASEECPLSDPQDLARTLTERLTTRLARPVDLQTRDRARLHLLDWLACVAGARRDPIAAIARIAEPDPMTRAALLGNILEMDDVDRLARLHPGPVIWPAALCAIRDELARQGPATMADLLDGAVRGYEAMITIGRMLDDHHYALWHPTTTTGGFGAVAAAASIYRLTPQQAVWALGSAGSLAGGLWAMRHEPVMTKALHVAHAGLAALWFARLARAGFTGPSAILEGPQGMFAAMVAAPRVVPDTPILDIQAWRITQTSFKPWPACRHVHAAIDAAIALGPAIAGKGPIHIETYADALRFCDQPRPTTAAEAKFSLQHAIAVVATSGPPGLADFEPGMLARPDLVAARARIQVAIAPDLDAAYPAHFGARVSAGGQTMLAADALGDPENPLGRNDIIAKLAALTAWGGLLGIEAEGAATLALDSDDTAPAAPLLDLLTRWTA